MPDLKMPKNLVLPNLEDIADPTVKDAVQKLMTEIDINHKKIYEDLQTLAILLQNVDGNLLPDTDDTYYLGEVTSPFKAFKALILKDTTDGKHYKITSVNGVLTITALD